MVDGLMYVWTGLSRFSGYTRFKNQKNEILLYLVNPINLSLPFIVLLFSHNRQSSATWLHLQDSWHLRPKNVKYSRPLD